MKNVFAILLFTIAACTTMNAQPDLLNKHQWNDRVILVFAPTIANEDFVEQINALKEDPLGIIERNLVIYQIFEDSGIPPAAGQVTANEVEALRQHYKIKDNDFTVLLIGKDGGEKLRQQSPVTLDKLFSTIDAMPMRQSEMRRGE